MGGISMQTSLTTCIRCQRQNRPGRLHKITLWRRGEREYLQANQYLDDWLFVADRSCFMCHACRHQMVLQKIIWPLLSIPMVALVTWVVMRNWQAAGEYRVWLGIGEATAVFWCFAGLGIIWKVVSWRVLMPEDYRDFLAIEALYPRLRKEFGDRLIQWIDHFEVGQTLVFGDAVGKIHPKTELEARVLKPKAQLKAEINKPFVPGKNERPITFFALGILFPSLMTILLRNKWFPIIPTFLDRKDWNEGVQILLGFGIMIPQVLVIAGSYLIGLILVGYGIWLTYYRFKHA